MSYNMQDHSLTLNIVANAVVTDAVSPLANLYVHELLSSVRVSLDSVEGLEDLALGFFR